MRAEARKSPKEGFPNSTKFYADVSQIGRCFGFVNTRCSLKANYTSIFVFVGNEE